MIHNVLFYRKSEVFMAGAMRKKRRRKEAKKAVAGFMVDEYRQMMQEAASSPEVMSALHHALSSDPYTGNEKLFRSQLECEVIGQMISSLIGETNPRASLLELTQGSRLGSALKEVFPQWDQLVNNTQLQDFYLESLKAMHREIESEISRVLSMKQGLEDLEPEGILYDPSSDDLPF